MIIKRNIYKSIINCCPKSPVEKGGIIGKRKGVIVAHFFDNSCAQYGIYAPDVENLNAKITQWYTQGINFCGIYHSHYPSNENLSLADVEYIKCICEENQAEKHLYFPIVIPQKKITAYKATLKNGKLSVKKNRVFIIL